MKTKIVIAAVAVMAGCAVTPNELRQTGTQYTTTSVQPPAKFAACVSANAENANFQVRSRRIETLPGGVETLLYVTQDGQLSAVMLSDAAPDGTGTKAVATLSNRLLGHERAVRNLVSPC